MVRGIYTGASGMSAQQVRLDAISNNLANLDTDGYKRDVAVHKSFASLLLRRMDDDGVTLNPFGSGDMAPVVGKIGTGVENNEIYTEFEQGALKQTESDFDLAMDGKGFFAIQTPYGERYTRTAPSSSARKAFSRPRKATPSSARTAPSRSRPTTSRSTRTATSSSTRTSRTTPSASSRARRTPGTASRSSTR